jgi:hypothetical protein
MNLEEIFREVTLLVYDINRYTKKYKRTSEDIVKMYNDSRELCIDWSYRLAKIDYNYKKITKKSAVHIDSAKAFLDTYTNKDLQPVTANHIIACKLALESFIQNNN